MLTIIRYILLTAKRDFLFLGIGLMLLATIGLAFFLGTTSLVEQEQMTLAVLAGSTRFILIFGLIVFIVFHIRRSFENKEMELLLSRPISRSHIIFAYWAGFALLALCQLIPLLLVILLTTPVDFVGLLFWGGHLLFEIFIIIAFAILCSFMLSSASLSVLITLSFYVLSRLMGFMVAGITLPHTLDGWLDGSSLLEMVLMLVSVILPRLDLFSQSEWLIYGANIELSLFLPFIQASFYIPLLLVITLYDFRRKPC